MWTSLPRVLCKLHSKASYPTTHLLQLAFRCVHASVSVFVCLCLRLFVCVSVYDCLSVSCLRLFVCVYVCDCNCFCLLLFFSWCLCFDSTVPTWSFCMLAFPRRTSALSSAKSHPTTRLQVLTAMFSRPMQLAEYFCTGFYEDEDEYHHYALNVPLYTHFTSPIRR